MRQPENMPDLVPKDVAHHLLRLAQCKSGKRDTRLRDHKRATRTRRPSVRLRPIAALRACALNIPTNVDRRLPRSCRSRSRHHIHLHTQQALNLPSHTGNLLSKRSRGIADIDTPKHAARHGNDTTGTDTTGVPLRRRGRSRHDGGCTHITSKRHSSNQHNSDDHSKDSYRPAK